MALSFVTYTGDGSNRIFNLTFSYLQQSEVGVKVDNVAVTFTWLDSSRVQLTTAPAFGAFVEVRRTSSRTARVVDFQDGSVLNEAALDADSDQLFNLSQEAFDASASTIPLDFNNTFNAGSRLLKSLADPVDAQDAVTKSWAESGMTSQLALADAAQAAALVSQNAALVSQNASEASKVISTAQAVISTDKAAESLASEVISTAKSVISTDKAAIATTKAEEALASQNAASTSETNAAASLDAFDDRFLGSFATAPTVDNDNDALATGTVYWNSTSSRMYAWTGSVWETLKPTNTEQAHINTVAGITADVTAVANDATDISAVAAKATEIGLLGTASAVADMVILGTTDVVADMNTLAAVQANVTTVADISSNVTTVAGISANVTTVADNTANINTLVGDMASVNSFADKYRVQADAPTTSLDSGDLWWNTANNELRAYSTGTGTWAATAPTAANQAAIDVVAGDIVYIEDMGLITSAVTSGTGSNITAVGESITEVRAVAGSLSEVVTVAGDIANVNSVAGNTSNINSAVGNASNINSAVGNAADITLVAGNATNINNAVSNSSNINNAVSNSANINSVVSNSGNINLAAGSISNVNQVGNAISNVNAVAAALADINTFSEQYKISATAPAGPSAGDLWYDATAHVLKYYSGSVWELISAGIQSLLADTTPQLGGALDAQNNNMTNVGTISGSNLQLDFGGL
jgi:hypothetical protein